MIVWTPFHVLDAFLGCLALGLLTNIWWQERKRK